MCLCAWQYQTPDTQTPKHPNTQTPKHYAVSFIPLVFPAQYQQSAHQIGQGQAGQGQPQGEDGGHEVYGTTTKSNRSGGKSRTLRVASFNP